MLHHRLLLISIAALGTCSALRRDRPGAELELAARGARREAQELVARAAPLVDLLVGWQQNVTLVDVGACDGDFAVGSLDPVQSALASSGVRAVLVEPNPTVFETLKERVAANFGDASRITLVEAAVSPNASGTVPFYVVSPKLMRDFPASPDYLVREVSSMSYEHVLKHHSLGRFSEEELKPYIQEIRVPSKSPAELLRGAGLAPGDVDVLKVDAEGYDADIVHAFMDMPGFSPKIVIFEVLHLLPLTYRRLRKRLEETGFRLDCKNHDCSMNVLAFAKSYFD